MRDDNLSAQEVMTRQDAYSLRQRTRGEATLAVLAALALCGGLSLYALLRLNLPVLQGDLALAGFTAPVSVERDALGVPTLTARNPQDRARALGVLHAQDRFFQMDLLRRTAAGELAALFGASAVALDRGKRLHRFRARARAAVTSLPHDERTMLDAYVEGVNIGLAQMSSRPFEYWLLRSVPEPWRAEDSLLVVYTMYLNLQDETASRDNTLALLRSLVGEAAFAFLAPTHTTWDASLDGMAIAEPARAPAATWRKGPLLTSSQTLDETDTPAFGSNNFAVSGALTATGAGLVAGDMHLELRVPNIWYRASWYLEQEPGIRVTGVTLPGMPVMVAGSNGRVAWTFTNSFLDVSDLLTLEWADAQPGRFMTPDGPAHFEFHEEIIQVRGGAAPHESLLVAETPWGPLLDADASGRYRVVRWIAHDPKAVDMYLFNMESVRHVEEALAIANASGIPAQNILAVDTEGHVGWSIAGPLPQRVSPTTAGVMQAHDPATAWQGVLPAHDYPRYMDPANARLWTANNRVLNDPMLNQIGDGGYYFAARGRQIRDGLQTLTPPIVEQHLLAIQLDDRALLLERWHQLLLRVLDVKTSAQRPMRAALRAELLQWNGHASVDSVAYRIVRAFRIFAADKIFGAMFAELKRQDARFDYRAATQWEEPLWALIEQRAPMGLAQDFTSWDAQLLAVVDEVGVFFERAGGDITQRTWGERNTLAMDHPFAKVMPRLKSWLGMPAQPLPGDVDVPRVQGIDFGASQRMVVSPGHEQLGVFHMPGGQSGNPLSAFYRAGHAAWATGSPTAFLPGTTQYTLMLLPVPSDAPPRADTF